jgi:hypothetical protein
MQQICPAACFYRDLHMVSRCGIDVDPSKARIAQHLAAGVMVLPEDFLVHLPKLRSSPQELTQQLDRPNAPLHEILSQALFATGERCACGKAGWLQGCQTVCGQGWWSSAM